MTLCVGTAAQSKPKDSRLKPLTTEIVLGAEGESIILFGGSRGSLTHPSDK
jgi:hypothetical protein